MAGAMEDMEFFEKQVRPVLIARCYECHSVEKKVKGGLALDTREGTLKGGDTGPALVSGDPDKSLLIEAVRYKNQDMQMPPKGKLEAAEIQVLEEWVKRGAPDPRTATVAVKAGRVIDINEGRKFWSFAPLAAVTPPAVPQASSPIDAFIQAKLREKGLSAAPPADKRTLIRRATFDLIGLPPTPEQVDAFLADNEPKAFERLIERLLASPQYGERWGRHWLDVARYADSNGMDENVAFGHAWRYRDYVVRAFNNDKPFDQFLIEQVAGDLLPPSEEAITATGFLALGARVLAEPDVRKLEMDIIDEQIDTLGKAFLGMTFGCARCHDHKFDPITHEDYYALAAIFRSTRSLSSEKMGAIKYWHEYPTPTPEQLVEKKRFDEALAAKKAEVAEVIAKARKAVQAELHQRAAEYLAAAALLPAKATVLNARAAAKAGKLDAEFLLACRQYVDEHRDLPLFAMWRDCALTKDADAVREHYEPVFAEALKLKKGPAYEALIDPKGLFALPVKDGDVLDAATLAKIAAMNKKVAEFETKKRPEMAAVMSVTDAEIVKALPLHIRGSHLTLGKPVERGFPAVMRATFTKPVLPPEHSGRLELARWMASGEHPLTARVMVNRVWRWHFGQGIVSSTDNFGILGGKPSHPELLDWLARTFVKSGWSIKELHRLIMNSAVYQQASNISFSTSSEVDPRLVDPENRLLWRANIQRLEAEQIRDAMLFVSGWLNQEVGGKTIPLRNREFVFNHTSRDATTYESPRRALYLPIIRNNLYDMLEQFDYPDPTTPAGSRNSTVVAPQALIMMNAPVVMESSNRLAKRLAALADDNERLQQLYARLYGRPPLDHESARALALIRDLGATEKPERAWALLSQMLMAANEFIYLR
ncbi:MAG TPA: PSD1 and planctomycete cytochrome C domain-containing protein [Prosthecobacter sp.]|nr:PSD1 and planctomycete cytochrome C domain-containing protein [Prosthecobacter sp.]